MPAAGNGGAVALDIVHEVGRHLGERGPEAGGFGDSDLSPIGAFEHLGGGFCEVFAQVRDGSGGAVAETLGVVYAV